MTPDTDRGGFLRPGFRTLTGTVLLTGALAAIFTLDAQIQIFGFGDSGPDARSFPRLVLWALAGVVALRLILSVRAAEAPLGPRHRIGRVLGLIFVTGLALWSMPRFGFFPGAALAGIATTVALGERRPLLVMGLPVLVAAIVAYGGRHGLTIPLP